VVTRDHRCRTAALAGVISLAACSTLACGDEISPAPPVQVGLNLTLDNPDDLALGSCSLASSGTIPIGSPPPTADNQGAPVLRGEGGLTAAKCTVAPTAESQYDLSVQIETDTLRMSVNGQVLQGGTAQDATVTVVSTTHKRNLFATGCTVSAEPPFFAVDVHSFFGRVQCATSRDEGFSDLACSIDAILSLAYCGG
jgi:hypothetical protein